MDFLLCTWELSPFCVFYKPKCNLRSVFLCFSVFSTTLLLLSSICKYLGNTDSFHCSNEENKDNTTAKMPYDTFKAKFSWLCTALRAPGLPPLGQSVESWQFKRKNWTNLNWSQLKRSDTLVWLSTWDNNSNTPTPQHQLWWLEWALSTKIYSPSQRTWSCIPASPRLAYYPAATSVERGKDTEAQLILLTAPAHIIKNGKATLTE